jgi:hypothetical protein
MSFSKNASTRVQCINNSRFITGTGTDSFANILRRLLCRFFQFFSMATFFVKNKGYFLRGTRRQTGQTRVEVDKVKNIHVILYSFIYWILSTFKNIQMVICSPAVPASNPAPPQPTADCQSSGGLPPGMALCWGLTSVRGDRGENYENAKNI